MKNGKTRKITIIILALGLVLAAVITLTACNKDKTTPLPDLTKYFVEKEAAWGYSGSERLITLPQYVEIQNRSLTGSSATTSSQNYPAYRTNRSSYVDGYDGFVLTNAQYEISTTDSNGVTTKVTKQAGLYQGFYRIGDDEVTIPVQYPKIYFLHGLIAVMNDAGEIGIYDSYGNVIFECGDAVFAAKGTATPAESNKLETVVTIFSPNYVGYKSGNYAQVFSVESKKMVASLHNTDLKNISIFDNYMVLKRTESSKDNITIITIDNSKKLLIKDIPTGGPSWFEEISTASADLLAPTYLGNGKFFIFSRTEGASDNYVYQDIDESYKICTMWKYDAVRGTRTPYISDNIFISLVNSYYAESVALDVNGFLKPGYTYASYVLTLRPDKKVDFDQMIVDEDLNVMVSLSKTLKGQIDLKKAPTTTTKVSDIALIYTDGYAVPADPKGVLRLYDKHGNALFSLADLPYSYAHISDGNIIAATTTYASEDDTTGTTKYGIVGFDGKVRLPFEYDFISDFSAGYALALKWGEVNKKETYTFAVIDKKGNVVPDTDYIKENIAVTNEGKPLYMNGVYAYLQTEQVTDPETQQTTEVKWYGLKNFSPNPDKSQLIDGLFKKITIVITNNSKSTNLAAKHPEQIFAFTQDETGGVWSVYRIY
jgi:hypothetical protein